MKIREHGAHSAQAEIPLRSDPEFLSIPQKERLTAQYEGAVQCDASDKRDVPLGSGESFSTTCLLVGEFDILAAGLFGFRDCWDFGFALNRDLPRSRKKLSAQNSETIIRIPRACHLAAFCSLHGRPVCFA